MHKETALSFVAEIKTLNDKYIAFFGSVYVSSALTKVYSP